MFLLWGVCIIAPSSKPLMRQCVKNMFVKSKNLYQDFPGGPVKKTLCS